jgi:hypothetical protein
LSLSPLLSLKEKRVNKPHKHAEVIKAWADGAEIQVRGSGEPAIWRDNPEPRFLDCLEYRVKPEKKQLWVRPYSLPGLGPTVCDLPKNSFDAVFGNRYWLGPAVLVWEEE